MQRINKSGKARGSLSSLLFYKNDPGLRQLHSSGIPCASQDASAHEVEEQSQVSPALGPHCIQLYSKERFLRDMPGGKG